MVINITSQQGLKVECGLVRSSCVEILCDSVNAEVCSGFSSLHLKFKNRHLWFTVNCSPTWKDSHREIVFVLFLNELVKFFGAQAVAEDRGAANCCKLAISLGLGLTSCPPGPGHWWWSGGQRMEGASKHLELRRGGGGS